MGLEGKGLPGIVCLIFLDRDEELNETRQEPEQPGLLEDDQPIRDARHLHRKCFRQRRQDV